MLVYLIYIFNDSIHKFTKWTFQREKFSYCIAGAIPSRRAIVVWPIETVDDVSWDRLLVTPVERQNTTIS